MSLIRKRKLTNNQARRIHQNNTATELDESTLSAGVIVSHFGKQLDIQLTDSKDDNLQAGMIYRCHTRTNLPLLTAGDKVLVSFDEVAKLGRIEKLVPRTTLITRPDRYHKVKPVASNVDTLAIVFAPVPKPATSLIDRYLLMANHAQVKPVLILNKIDLCTDKTHAETLDIIAEYQSLGIDTLAVSSQSSQGLGELQALLDDKLTIFAGQSGVGKSSLINQLLPTAMQSTNIISTNSQLGQHTTTTSRLLPFDAANLAKGGIIDTPGIREYGVWHLSITDVANGFVELQPLMGQCQFRDCNHKPNTKGCALWQAVADGTVLARRVDSFNQLMDEVKTATAKS